MNKEQKSLVNNLGKLETVEASISTAKVTYVNGQLEEAAKIDISKLDADDIAALEAVKDLMANWLTEEEAAKLDADAQKAFNDTCSKVEEAAQDLSKAKVSGITAKTYTGSAITQNLTVTDMTGKTIDPENYDVTYSNNVNAGTATILITGKNGYTNKLTASFKINPANINGASISGVADRYYTGKARTQTGLKVTVAGKAVSTANCKVAYSNNKNVGQAKVTITGQGNYTGTITKNFVIKPRKVSNVKVTKGKKRVTVRYKKQNGARYQIYYKTTGSKAKTVKTAAVKRTIKKLKSGKTYTIKVRAYKKIGSKTYYGKYSAAKKVRVR